MPTPMRNLVARRPRAFGQAQHHPAGTFRQKDELALVELVDRLHGILYPESEVFRDVSV